MVVAVGVGIGVRAGVIPTAGVGRTVGFAVGAGVGVGLSCTGEGAGKLAIGDCNGRSVGEGDGRRIDVGDGLSVGAGDGSKVGVGVAVQPAPRETMAVVKTTSRRRYPISEILVTRMQVSFVGDCSLPAPSGHSTGFLVAPSPKSVDTKALPGRTRCNWPLSYPIV